MGMILGKTDFEELILVKEEFAGDVEDLLNEAIGSKTCQRRMEEDGSAEAAQEIVSQVIEQDEHLLGMPEALAPVSEEQALLIIANVNFGGSAQIIAMADFWGGRVQVSHDEQGMLELVFVHIEPTQSQGPGWDTEVQLLERRGHPAAAGLDLLPVLDLLAPGARPATRIVLGTQLIALVQEPIQVRIGAKPGIQPQAHLLALLGAQSQDPF